MSLSKSLIKGKMEVHIGRWLIAILKYCYVNITGTLHPEMTILVKLPCIAFYSTDLPGFFVWRSRKIGYFQETVIHIGIRLLKNNFE